MPKYWPLIAALAVLLALPWGLAAPALAAETPGVGGLKNPPSQQDAVKERNLKAPGKLTGQPPARGLGKMAPPAKAKLRRPGAEGGQETPQSFRERHRLHPGAGGGQGSRDVLLHQRIQGQRPPAQERPKPPATAQPPGPPPASDSPPSQP